MNIRKLESLTKEELIELIRDERWGEPVGEVAWTYKGAYSVGNVFFPKDGPLPSGTKLYTATQTTAPAQEPSDTQMLDWIIENEAVVSFLHKSRLYEVWFCGACIETEKTARKAIINAMKDKK